MNSGDGQRNAGFERQLIDQIAGRHRQLQRYLGRMRPRNARLGLVAVVTSALAAVVTAGPAVGGDGFAVTVQDALSLTEPSLVWRSLCLIALLVSVVSTISTNLLRSQNTAAQISAAETASAELHGLRLLIEVGDIPLTTAVKLYQESVVRTSFLENSVEQPGSRPDDTSGRVDR